MEYLNLRSFNKVNFRKLVKMDLAKRFHVDLSYANFSFKFSIKKNIRIILEIINDNICYSPNDF